MYVQAGCYYDWARFDLCFLLLAFTPLKGLGAKLSEHCTKQPANYRIGRSVVWKTTTVCAMVYTDRSQIKQGREVGAEERMIFDMLQT